MRIALTMLGAVGVGTWLRYFLNPKRRNRDPADTTRSGDRLQDDSDKRFRAGARSQRAADHALTARIRAKLAMLVRQPDCIEVSTAKGRVSLKGAAGADEVEHLLGIVAQVPGVSAVDNKLDVRDGDEQIGRHRAQPSPSTRGKTGLLSGATGGALAVYGLRKGSLAGAGIAAVGLGLLVSGLNHQDVRRLLGLKARARRRAEEWGRSKQREQTSDGPSAAGGGSRTSATGLRLKDIMTCEVKVVRPDVPVEAAAEAMRTLDVGAILVCDDGRMLGILTDRDIVLRTVAEKRDAQSVLVADVMTTDVMYGFEDDLVEEAALKMVERRIRRLPVLSRDTRLMGIVSLGDLAVHGMETTLSGEVLEYISQPAQPKRGPGIAKAAVRRTGDTRRKND
jgi:CBS domain-containing protein